MLKMVNCVHGRIAAEGYRALEHREQMKKGTKKILKGKNLNEGMIMLLSSLYQAAGEPTGEERAKTSDWSWTIFVICALLGALSISRWLWHCIKQFFLGYIVEVMRTKIPEDNTYQKVEVASVEIQAGCWIDLKALGVYEQESIKMQDKLFQLDLYIEELQEEFNQAREERNCRFQQLQILEGHAQKLMGQSLNYRVSQRGRVIHFNENCCQNLTMFQHDTQGAQIEKCTC
ncbi:unnamed protein product [Durusdinium trenchii]|uniref:Uncharacterized protein n=2 Tax=Durusdinium trenchii TaxID=1381693 RepID=A0ABP0QHD4_9DINO